MVIGSIDIEATKKIQERQTRNERASKMVLNYREELNRHDNKNSTVTQKMPTEKANTLMTPEICEASTSQEKKGTQMRVSLPSLALACERTGVSDRNAAIIASAVLED